MERIWIIPGKLAGPVQNKAQSSDGLLKASSNLRNLWVRSGSGGSELFTCFPLFLSGSNAAASQLLPGSVRVPSLGHGGGVDPSLQLPATFRKTPDLIRFGLFRNNPFGSRKIRSTPKTKKVSVFLHHIPFPNRRRRRRRRRKAT